MQKEMTMREDEIEALVKVMGGTLVVHRVPPQWYKEYNATIYYPAPKFPKDVDGFINGYSDSGLVSPVRRYWAKRPTRVEAVRSAWAQMLKIENITID
jgi:hypothetical protein